MGKSVAQLSTKRGSQMRKREEKQKKELFILKFFLCTLDSPNKKRIKRQFFSAVRCFMF